MPSAPTDEDWADALWPERFPRSAKYDFDWVRQNKMGPNPLWLAEWLCEAMELRPGMRVLDLGCGKALSSVFLAREFGVRVWATDLWIPPTENWTCIRAAGLEQLVTPIYANAREIAPVADRHGVPRFREGTRRAASRAPSALLGAGVLELAFGGLVATALGTYWIG